MSVNPMLTVLARQLGDDNTAVRAEAARQLWQFCAPRLLALARANLPQWLRRRVDEEDILQSVFHAVCRDFQDGKCSVENRQKLWSLLVVYTLNKAAAAREFHTAQRRDPRRECGAPGADAAGDSSFAAVLDALADSQPTPEEEALARLEFERRLNVLPEGLREIVLWKLAGLSNDEIASMLGRTRRTVELKLRCVRDQWQAEDEREERHGQR
jgi:RNA polymerase sigma factor (sigma-70 family)